MLKDIQIVQRFPNSIFGEYFSNGVYVNPNGQNAIKKFKDFLRWQFENQRKKWPSWIHTETVKPVARVEDQKKLELTYVNHATFLLQTAGLNILTDPVWSQRVSPFSSLGPKRVHAPGVRFEDLPKIDWVLVSHNHFDHMDEACLRRLSQEHKGCQFLIAKGDGKHLRKWGIQNFAEMDWGQQVLASPQVQFTFLPAQHWSGRWLNDRQHSLWGAFAIEVGKYKIYFAGDTGYGEHFLKTNELLGAMDLTLLPIGAYEPRWFMKEAHMNPEEAVQAHLDLQARISVGMHYGTFQLTDEGIDDPVLALKEAQKSRGVAEDVFRTMEIAQKLQLQW